MLDFLLKLLNITWAVHFNPNMNTFTTTTKQAGY